MASTDINGKPILILGEGQPLTLVIGETSYRGTLHRRGDTENWYVKLDDGEIEIYKRETT